MLERKIMQNLQSAKMGIIRLLKWLSQKTKGLHYEKIISLYSLSYLYFIVPLGIFFVCWMKWYFALPLTLGLFVAYFFMIKSAPKSNIVQLIKQKPIKFFVCTVLTFIWIKISGIGGFAFQTFDFEARNSIFNQLIYSEWPPTSVASDGTQYPLNYYFLIFLIPALLAKLFGVWFGQFALLGFCYIGLVLTLLLIFNHLKKVSLLATLVLIFFSGCDLLGIKLLNGNRNDFHLEWWSNYMGQNSSNSTQPFWVFNQAIPAWLATALLFSQKNIRSVGMIVAMTMLFCTFPFVGIAIIAFGSVISKLKVRDLKAFLGNLFSFQNVFSLFIIMISYLFLYSNMSSGNLINFDFKSNALKEFLIENGLLIILTFFFYKKNLVYYFAIISMLICVFFKTHELGMRANIPGLFFLMMCCIEILHHNLFALKSIFKPPFKFAVFAKTLVSCLLLITLCYGAVGAPYTEVKRAVTHTKEKMGIFGTFFSFERNSELLYRDDRKTPWAGEDYAQRFQYSADINSIFYQLFAKH